MGQRRYPELNRSTPLPLNWTNRQEQKTRSSSDILPCAALGARSSMAHRFPRKHASFRKADMMKRGSPNADITQKQVSHRHGWNEGYWQGHRRRLHHTRCPGVCDWTERTRRRSGSGGPQRRRRHRYILSRRRHEAGGYGSGRRRRSRPHLAGSTSSVRTRAFSHQPRWRR